MRKLLIILFLVTTSNLKAQTLRLQFTIERVPVVGHGFPEKSKEIVTFKWHDHDVLITTERDTFDLKFDERTLMEHMIYKQGDQRWWLDAVHEKHHGLRVTIIPLKPYTVEYSLNLTYEKITNNITNDRNYIGTRSN